MSLVALYDALKAADVPDDKAAAAVEAVQDSRDEAWKRRIEREIAALRQELTEFKGEIRSEMAEMKAELKGEMADMKAELKGEMANMKAELKGEMAEMKGELKGEINEIRGKMAGMTGDIRRLDAQLKLMFGIVVPLLVAILVRSFWV